jgi:hypothetical protein
MASTIDSKKAKKLATSPEVYDFQYMWGQGAG